MRHYQTAFLLLAFLLFSGRAAHAQEGTLAGIIFDANTGQPVRQAKIGVLELPEVEAVTSPDGSYQLKLPAGTYTLTVQAEQYLPATLDNLVVTAGEVIDGSTVLVSESTVTEVEVVERVEATTATAESVVLERKLAPTVSDAISAEDISKSTASDAAGALEKVTGVSVVGDGYVYVRGLGERYSATMLNNALITTTDPEKRVIPLDLFPAQLIDNIKVVKTYSADLPGEFSGGLVQMRTMEFPTAPVMQVSMSTGFNSQTTGERFFTYPGGDSDFFGFDDGFRDLPGSIPSDQPLFRGDFSGAELAEFGQSFPAIWDTASQDSARLEQSYSLVAGKTFGGLGVVGAVTFSNKLNRLPQTFRTFNVGGPGQQVLFSNFDDFRSDTETARLGGVLNLAYRFSTKHRLSVRNTFTHDADKEGRTITGFSGARGQVQRSERLRWIERGIFATQIEGEHLTDFRNSVFTWQLGISRATRNEPDLREIVRVARAGDNFAFSSSPDSGIRFFSDLEDTIWEPTGEWSIPFFKGPVSGSFEIGFRGTFRDRSFSARRFRYVLTPLTDVDPTAPGNEIFAPENIDGRGIQFFEFTRGTDTYTADMTIYGGYFNADLALGRRWRVIAGLRIEDFEENVLTLNPLIPGAVPVAAGLAKRDPLPAVNVVYSLTPQQNLRFGWGGTVSRPDFRELSPFNFTQVVGGVSTTGNPDLLRTSINNFDARWEWFFGGDQLIAASYFFKDFNDPIELVLRPGDNQRQTWINADSARNQGLEVEFRRNLGFISPALLDFNLVTNITFVDSEIKIPEDAPFTITNLVRPLIGQSRYLFNSAFEWNRPRWRSNARFYTNFFSDRISQVGADGLDDVFEEGRVTLDFVYEFLLREEGNYKIRFEAENMTNEDFLWTQGGELKQFYRLGRTFSVGLSFSLTQ